MNDWPSSPLGVGNAKRFHDAKLKQLVEWVRDDNAGWFELVTPPKEPPDVESLPDFVREDILEDHKENLAAAPSEPTEEYRLQTREYLEEARNARSRVRPKSLTPLEEMPDGIVRKTGEDRVFYHPTDELRPREDDIPRAAAETTDGGKYLFFTANETGVLERIVFEQFQKRPFESAKVPTGPNRKDDAVLCLYYDDDRYKEDLRATYQNEPVIMPRGFKPGR